MRFAASIVAVVLAASANAQFSSLFSQVTGAPSSLFSQVTGAPASVFSSATGAAGSAISSVTGAPASILSSATGAPGSKLDSLTSTGASPTGTGGAGFRVEMSRGGLAGVAVAAVGAIAGGMLVL